VLRRRRDLKAGEIARVACADGGTTAPRGDLVEIWWRSTLWKPERLGRCSRVRRAAPGGLSEVAGVSLGGSP
jgi:hypothetical protein